MVGDVSADEPMQYWQLSDEQRAELLAKFRAAGAKAIVAGPVALRGSTAHSDALRGWQPLGDSGFEIYLLGNPR